MELKEWANAVIAWWQDGIKKEPTTQHRRAHIRGVWRDLEIYSNLNLDQELHRARTDFAVFGHDA